MSKTSSKRIHTSDVQPEFGFPWDSDTFRIERGILKSNLSTEQAEALIARNPAGAEKLADIIENHEDWATQDPLEWTFTLHCWQKVLSDWSEWTSATVFGGNRCLAPESLIYDPVADAKKPISEIDTDFHVLAWDGVKLVQAKAEKPYKKESQEIYRVHLPNEMSFACSKAHRVLTPVGYRSVGHLKSGDELLLSFFGDPEMPSASSFRSLTSSDTSLLGSQQGVLHCLEKLQDCLDGYSEYLHHDDEQLLREKEHDLIFVLQRIYALSSSYLGEYISSLPYVSPSMLCSSGQPWGDLAEIFPNIHSYLDSDLLSTLGDQNRYEGQFFGNLCYAFYRLCKSALVLFDRQQYSIVLEQSRLAFCRLAQSIGESVPQDSLFYVFLPYFRDNSIKTYSVKIEKVEYLRNDSVWDFNVPVYHNYYHGGAIHHNSGKSFFSAALVVWLLENIPEAEIRCFHVSEERSIQDQQAMVWAMLPEKYKNMTKKKGPNHSIQYSQKNGFTDNKLILPPHPGRKKGSYIYFNNYKQYQHDKQVAEGFKAHFIWCDEEAPKDLVITLLSRLTDYRGKLLLTFTTLQGWTDLVSEILNGAKTVEKRHSDYVNMKLPVKQLSKKFANMNVYYWWTRDNPFVESDALEAQFSGQPLEIKLARLHGVPSKAFHNRLPRFNRHVNVIPHDDLPFVKDPDHKVTRYHICDPAGSKPWFMLWAAVDYREDIYIYAEFPDITMGEWALPWTNAAGKPIGKAGGGQRPLGYGYEEYKQTIIDIEGKAEIFERIIDPRMGKYTQQAASGETNIIQEMGNLGFYFKPAPADDEDQGIGKINDYLAWDSNKPLSDENRPRLYVSDRCENTITAMLEYMGVSREEAYKDPVDCVRYLCVSDPIYIGSNYSVGTECAGGY